MKINKFKNLVGNKIFTVNFIKANGENRTINARLGVSKYVKNSKPITTAKRNNTLASNDKIGVFEMKGTSNENNYRTINLNTINWLKVSGKEYNSDLNLK